MSLPTVAVTFLFTGIEGCTALWERHPAAMRHAPARHDALLRRVIGRHRVHGFKTVADAFFAAFVPAPDAVRTALPGQQALVGERAIDHAQQEGA